MRIVMRAFFWREAVLNDPPAENSSFELAPVIWNTPMRAEATLRMRDGAPLVTDNGQHILDVRGLAIRDPLGFESEVNQWPGVVTVGVFAHQRAQVCLLGTPTGVRTLSFD